MGYDIHITRSADWIENNGQEIPEAEWQAVVEADPEMRFLGDTAPNYPLAAEWLGHPQLQSVWFDYADGNITVKSPDERTLNKMQQIAQKLDARVQGQEREFYDEPLEIPPSLWQSVKAWWTRPFSRAEAD